MAAAGGDRTIGFGVVGCAGIAAKTCRGIAESGNAAVVAVGSRSLEKAQRFVKDSAPSATAYDSYEAVLEDAKVDVVYVPLPTTMKKEWVLKCAARGKHVLCEKPLAATLEDTQEMVAACRQAGVQFMDNTMFMHHDRLPQVREVCVAGGSIGSIKQVASAFSIPCGNDEEWASQNIRTNASTEPHGCLGDLGWYNIRVSQYIFGYEEPQDVRCSYFEATSDGVPITAQGVLRYSGGRFASFDCSFKCTLRQWVEVVGEKRTVFLEDFVVTNSLEEASFTVAEAAIGELAVTFPKVTSETSTVKGCVQHARLAHQMAALVQGGKVDDHWPSISLQTQRILLACHESATHGGNWTRLAPAMP